MRERIWTSSLVSERINYGGRDIQLITAIDDWCARVVKLARDVEADPEDDSVWSVYDLIGAYILRDSIENGLDRVRRGREVELATVKAADTLLAALCRVDDARVLERLDPEAHSAFWWWRMIPRAGPIAAETDHLDD
jgi:hypothetical protein